MDVPSLYEVLSYFAYWAHEVNKLLLHPLDGPLAVGVPPVGLWEPAG
jgi:hypothetical protein